MALCYVSKAIFLITPMINTVSHYTFLTKNVPKENRTECSKHINKTTYDSTNTTGRPYFGLFLPQGNLNFGNTGAYLVDILLNTTGTFNESSIEMRAFDSGKFFFIKTNNESLYHVFFSFGNG